MVYTKKSFLLFIVLAFAPVWGGCLALMLRPVDAGMKTLVFMGFMFMPALASILTRLICREGFSDMYLRPRFRGTIKRYAVAWLLPGLLCILGAVIYFLLVPGMFDPASSQLVASGVTSEQLPLVLAAQFALLLFAPLINLIPCLGEELGWRGYLLRKLACVMSERRAAVVTGIIWGFWHAPMIALGHNYGLDYPGYPWLGILMMTVFCVLFGTLVALLTFRTKSAIPAALAHAGLNGSASIGLLFCFPGYNPLIGPYLMGAIGGIPLVVAGVICYLMMKRERGEAEPEGAAEPAEQAS